MNTPPSKTDQARQRLELLYIDTQGNAPRAHGFLREEERQAIRIVLDELHRLNTVASAQRKALQSIADRKNKATRKPASKRPQPPTTLTPRKSEGRRPGQKAK